MNKPDRGLSVRHCLDFLLLTHDKHTMKRPRVLNSLAVLQLLELITQYFKKSELLFVPYGTICIQNIFINFNVHALNAAQYPQLATHPVF